ncbi:unnamed protein product [Oreochromis niloticus]|nr:unnamed protein product [Mustela putorius furo]
MMSSTQKDQHGPKSQRSQEADKPHRRKREKNYSCDLCGKSFPWDSCLRKHQLFHSGVKAYSCDQCDRAFDRSCSLQRHLVTHSGTKTYSCDICGKTFSRRDSRNRHLRIHTRHVVYWCDQRGQRFITDAQLQSHMFTHTEEKPYKCDLCEKTFELKKSRATQMDPVLNPVIAVVVGKTFVVTFVENVSVMQRA